VQDVNPLNPYHWLALAAVVAALTAGYFGWQDHQRDIGREEARSEAKAAATAQTQRMRDLQRAAELRYTVTSQVREKWFVATVKEIRDAAAPLASCPVPDRAVGLLNAARECASGDPAAACGAGDGVPAP
jgi:hypothetical protein